MAVYSGKNYEYLFNEPSGNINDNAFETLRHRDVFRYRVVTITSGRVVEVEAFPLWRDYDNSGLRAAKLLDTREEQKEVNRRNLSKRIARLADTNFTQDDLHVTLTYGSDSPLPDEKQAREHMRKFIRKARDYRKKHGLTPLKYIYSIEYSNGDGRRTRVHHHVIMSGMDRHLIKSIWPHGRATVDELQPENETLTGLARYITKQPRQTRQTKQVVYSRNLKKPKETKSDHKLSKKQAERLATDVKAAAHLIFLKSFPDCVLDQCTVKSSEFVAGAYIYAKMHKEAKKKWAG